MFRSCILSTEILKDTTNSFNSNFNYCLNANLISHKTTRLFAVWCFRDTLNWVSKPDTRSIEAANVAEKYALGLATEAELSAAASAAWSAAESAESAASAASAAESAESAAWSATWSAASAAASAAWSAAESAESAAWSATWSAARITTEIRQCAQLIKMIEEELREETFIMRRN